MIKHTLTIVFAFIISINLNAQNNNNNNNTCLNFNPFCLGTTYTSAANSQAASISDPGNDYNCLSSTPNPSWYYLKTSIPGQIEMTLSAPADIDFIIYGPFTSSADISNNCGTLGSPTSPMVDCSYSATNVETPSITSIAAGEYYILLVTNYVNTVQDITLEQTGGDGQLDCAIFNQIGFQSMTGKIFYDINQNGINDLTDIPIPNFSYQVSPANFTGYSNYNGLINYNTQTQDTIDYEVSSSHIGWSATTTNPYQFTLDTANNTMDTLLFGFYPNSIIQDINLDIISNSTQCVANNLIWLNINNIGTDTVNGNYTFHIPSELEFVSCSQYYDSIVNNNIYFSFDSLNLFETITFPIQLQPVSSGIINIGDTITYTAELDLYSIDNQFISTYNDTIEYAVVCSYDPNIKLSFPNRSIASELIQPIDSLEYIIHFQNTGNAAAVDITITDTLSSKFDLSTFKSSSSSHQPSVSIDSDRILTFQFDNIMLPDSNSNEPLSHGFVKFEINLIENLPPHDTITNAANIFFDFNAPIITNTALNVIDCYIIPQHADFTLINYEIHSNLNDHNYTYIWTFNSDTLLNENSNYIPSQGNGEYTLIVSNEYQCETNSTYSLSLSINENDDNSVLIYPIPSSSEFTIKSSNQLISSILITDINGKIYKTINNINFLSTVITDDVLESGTYYIEITTTENQIITKRIIKL